MANNDKEIDQLPAASSVTSDSLIPIKQAGKAMKLTAKILEMWLLKVANSHGGISGVAKVSSVGLVDTYRITMADGSKFDFTVTNGQKGDTGATGPQGPKGDKGEDGTVAFDNLTDAQKASLKGDKGDTGATGP